MIRLFRPTRPIELTEKKIEEFTKKYIETGNAVWKKAFIIKPLLQMTHNKCAYCECKLDIQGKSVTIDHFHCKSLYPEEVVSWDNLLPSCVHCNTNKGKLDTKEYHIIDPSKDNPKDYLYLSHYMIRSKDNSLTSKGRRTVDELQLNHRERLVWARIEIADNLIR